MGDEKKVSIAWGVLLAACIVSVILQGYLFYLNYKICNLFGMKINIVAIILSLAGMALFVINGM